jgi:hypothetical protein
MRVRCAFGSLPSGGVKIRESRSGTGIGRSLPFYCLTFSVTNMENVRANDSVRLFEFKLET